MLQTLADFIDAVAFAHAFAADGTYYVRLWTNGPSVRAEYRLPVNDDEGYEFALEWGVKARGDDGDTAYPHGVAVDSAGTVFVADTGNHRIQEFAPDGTFLAQFGTYGTGPGEFSAPTGVAVNSSGDVYVADRDNHRIQKFARVR